MSRSGYSEDCDGWKLIRWRGAVASAIRGRRGQAFLRELVAALDALPAPRLIAEALRQEDGEVCAIGAVGLSRGIDLQGFDPEDYAAIARGINLASALTQEIEWINDDAGSSRETPEDRFTRVRAWAVAQLKERP